MDNYNNQREPEVPRFSPALIPGLILVGIGALFLLGNLHIVHVESWFAYWPVILIAVGLVKLVDSTHTGGRIAGGVILALGGLFMADNLGYLTFRVEDLWPLILIGVGVMLLWNRTVGPPQGWWSGRHRARSWARARFDYQDASGGNSVHEFALFTGTRRVITAQDFRGGRIHCMFGGVSLDLTGANIVGDSAVLVISAIYGGAVVRVPTNWDVEMRGAGIFGGFADHTMHPPMGAGMKRFIVKGGAVFGGVTIKN